MSDCPLCSLRRRPAPLTLAELDALAEKARGDGYEVDAYAEGDPRVRGTRGSESCTYWPDENPAATKAGLLALGLRLIEEATGHAAARLSAAEREAAFAAVVRREWGGDGPDDG